MTLFAFAAGEGLSEHWTPHDATVQIRKGELAVEIAGVCAGGGTLRLPSAPPPTH